jgi:hypothetical protein
MLLMKRGFDTYSFEERTGGRGLLIALAHDGHGALEVAVNNVGSASLNELGGVGVRSWTRCRQGDSRMTVTYDFKVDQQHDGG